MNQSIYLESAYLAPVQYYTKLYHYPEVFTEVQDNYIKQTYRNRCHIATADGVLALSIPIEKPDTPKCVMKDIRISDHGKWRHLHWNALCSAYRHSPFFEYYEDDFRPFYEQKFEFLCDFNEALCHTVCRLMDLDVQPARTTEYQKELPSNITDARGLIHPKRSFSDDLTFSPRPYYQVFGQKHGFLPNLSIADLLFNMDPESLIVLQESFQGTENKPNLNL